MSMVKPVIQIFYFFEALHDYIELQFFLGLQ